MSIISWADINPEATAQIVEKVGGDGWTILSPSFFTKFLHENELSVIEEIVKEHASDFKYPKLTIYKEGFPVDSMKGVHTLDLLYRIAKDLELDAVSEDANAKMGRGAQAQSLTKGILEYLP